MRDTEIIQEIMMIYFKNQNFIQLGNMYRPMNVYTSWNILHTKVKSRSNKHFKHNYNPCVIETVIKNLSIKKCPGPDGLNTDVYPNFKELMPKLLKLIYNVERKEICLSIFYEHQLSWCLNYTGTKEERIADQFLS